MGMHGHAWACMDRHEHAWSVRREACPGRFHELLAGLERGANVQNYDFVLPPIDWGTASRETSETRENRQRLSRRDRSAAHALVWGVGPNTTMTHEDDAGA